MIVSDNRARRQSATTSGLFWCIASVAIMLTGSPISLLVSGAGHVSEFDIFEELPPRSFVGTVRSNPDIAELVNGTAGNSLRFSFRYPKGATASMFSIDDRSGDIRTGRRIDREQLCPISSCHILLDVTVLPVRYFRILRVRINVADLNDNTPTFANSRLSVEVRENASPGVLIALPTAEDADSGNFGVQRYEMTPLPDPSADYPFRLTVRQQTSSRSASDDDAPDVDAMEVLLTVTDRLDREVQSSYLLRLTAYDGGQPTPRSGTVDVTVVVIDANDNGPRFEANSYEADVNEDQPRGTTIVRVHATDPDEGLNGEVVYRIADQTPTTVSGGSSSSGSDTVIGKPFAIDNRTGEIYVAEALDAEKYVGYQLTVVAADRGVGSLPAYARVTVRVADANDNRPTIVINSLTESGRVEVVENSASGAFVAFVTARDSDTGKNGAVDCLITAGNNRFRLEPVSGTDSGDGGGEYKLITTTSFDRESGDEHIVTLRCADNGRPPLTAIAEIVITVVDVNDNAPTFDGGPLPTVAISEGNYVGAVLIAMNASDLDTGPNARLTYRIQPLDDTPEGAAEIDAQTGLVYATITFDYEMRREYRYRVTVADGGENVLSGTSLLVVRILDVNDERPLFEKPSYHFTIPENRPVGSPVGTVRATDSDVSPSFSRIVYSIVQGHGSFEVDPSSGALSTARRLDREETSVYELTIRAANDQLNANVGQHLPVNTHGLPPAAVLPQSTVTVIVRVEDENDNAPIVRFPTTADRLVIDVPVSAPIGTLLTRIEASDPDDGPNGALLYAVANGNEEGLFAIDRDTGTLTTARRLGQVNRDGSPSSSVADLSRSIRLVVTVRDRGTPERLAVADLTILVNCSTTASKISAEKMSYDDSKLAADDDIEYGPSGTLSSSSIFGALFSDSSHRVVVIAMVVSGSLLIIIVIVSVVAISLAVCRWRRRQSRKLSDMRRDEWLRQQASTACSDAGCSCGERRSAASNRSFCGNRTLQRRDSGSLAGSSVATSSMRGAGGRLTVLMPPMTSTSLSRGGTWSTAVIDTASCTDRDNDGDESEGDDVTLSTGLMKSSSSTGTHHTCRCDADRSQPQTVGLLTSVANNSSSDCSQPLLKPPTPSSLQRATPDVLRQASGATDSAYSAVPTAASTPGTTRSNSNFQRSSGSRVPPPPSGVAPRYHYHHPHHQRSSRRASKSPSGSLRVGYRPSSASSGVVAAVGGIHGSRRHRRRDQRHTSKSDMEMSDLNADIDSESEFSETTTCRDSGMDHSEDSDNLAPTGVPASMTSSMSTTPGAVVTVFSSPPLIIS